MFRSRTPLPVDLLMNLAAYTTGSLQDARSLLIEARRKRLTLDQVITAIERRLPPVDSVTPARRTEQPCPSCGRFVLVRPRGVAEPVLVCPACRWSIYEGVR